MSDVPVALEILVRSAIMFAVAEVLARVTTVRAARRIWIAASAAMLIVPLLVLSDARLPLPRRVAADVRAIAAPAAVASIEPWREVHYQKTNIGLERIARTIWVAGVLAVAAGLLVGYAAMRRLRRTSTLAPGSVTELVPDGVSARIARCDAPLTVGILRPSILLPPGVTSWQREKLRAAIAHELAHVRGRDPLWNAIAWIGCVVQWPNPLAWLARRRLNLACELASDHSAAAAAGGVRPYARILVEIAAEAVAARSVALASSMAAGSLELRVDRLLDPSPRRALRLVPAIAVVALAASTLDWHTLEQPLAEIPTARPLLDALDSPDPDARAAALFKLARWKGHESEVLPLLARHLADAAPVRSLPQWDYARDGWGPARHSWSAPTVSDVAAIGLASTGSRAKETLAHELRSASPVARRNAAWAFGELRHPRRLGRQDVTAITALLGDPSADVRAAAAWSLGDLGARRAREPLRTLLAVERDERARREARAALTAIEAGLSLEAFRH